MPSQISKSQSPVVAEHDRDGCDWPQFSVVTGIYCVSSRIYHFLIAADNLSE